MSRDGERENVRLNGVPRASGDEPQVSKALSGVGSCSPRERG